MHDGHTKVFGDKVMHYFLYCENKMTVNICLELTSHLYVYLYLDEC